MFCFLKTQETPVILVLVRPQRFIKSPQGTPVRDVGKVLERKPLPDYSDGVKSIPAYCSLSAFQYGRI